MSCKEIEEKLWKFCFYVKIEEYRKSIRKTVSLRDGQEGPDATPAAVSLALKARTHLAKLISAFTKFLSDGTSFYQEFMMKVTFKNIIYFAGICSVRNLFHRKDGSHYVKLQSHYSAYNEYVYLSYQYLFTNSWRLATRCIIMASLFQRIRS